MIGYDVKSNKQIKNLGLYYIDNLISDNQYYSYLKGYSYYTCAKNIDDGMVIKLFQAHCYEIILYLLDNYNKTSMTCKKVHAMQICTVYFHTFLSASEFC